MDLQKLFNTGDVQGLAVYPPPRPIIVITQPFLLYQTAEAFARVSPYFEIYQYGGGSETPAGVQRISDNLTRSHPLFDHSIERNSHRIICVSYQTFASKHGPNRRKSWLMKQMKKKPDEAESEKWSKHTYDGDEDWFPPFDLEGLFDEVILDEAQNTKGM